MQSRHFYASHVYMYLDGRTSERGFKAVSSALLHGASYLKPKPRNHRLDMQVACRLSRYRL
jgi:hypothetical protein